MGRELIKIERVDSWPTSEPGITGYTVTGETVEIEPRTLQFQTVNHWKASLCSQGKKTARLVWIGWRDTRYGHDIVTAELDTSRWEHEGAAS